MHVKRQISTDACKEAIIIEDFKKVINNLHDRCCTPALCHEGCISGNSFIWATLV